MIKNTVCFDDVLLLPQRSNINSREEINLSTSIGSKKFRFPVISSPMDTVTEEDMSLAMFKHGGLGIVHRYNTPVEQCNMIRNIASLFEETENFNIANIAAAIGISSDFHSRAKALYDCGARILCIDVAHGHHTLVEKSIKKITSY